MAKKSLRRRAVFLYVTFPTRTEAQSLARMAIEKHLAQCVNVMPAHQSLYRWRGKVLSQREFAALFKTSHEVQLRKLLEAEHSYEVPCIATFEPRKLNSSFKLWLLGST